MLKMAALVIKKLLSCRDTLVVYNLFVIRGTGRVGETILMLFYGWYGWWFLYIINEVWQERKKRLPIIQVVKYSHFILTNRIKKEQNPPL